MFRECNQPVTQDLFQNEGAGPQVSVCLPEARETMGSLLHQLAGGQDCAGRALFLLQEHPSGTVQVLSQDQVPQGQCEFRGIHKKSRDQEPTSGTKDLDFTFCSTTCYLCDTRLQFSYVLNGEIITPISEDIVRS